MGSSEFAQNQKLQHSLKEDKIKKRFADLPTLFFGHVTPNKQYFLGLRLRKKNNNKKKKLKKEKDKEKKKKNKKKKKYDFWPSG